MGLPTAILEASDRLTQDLILPAAPSAPDVCETCCDWDWSGTGRCERCDGYFEELGELTPVVPISLYSKPSAMRDRLKYYKDESHELAGTYGSELESLVRRFFFEHRASLASTFGEWDGLALVPSHARAEPALRCALKATTDGELGLIDCFARPADRVPRRSPSSEALELAEDVFGRDLVVLDDVYTTGATAQSAASTLREAGARVPAIVVVGRRLNADYHTAVAEIIQRQSSQPFKWTTAWWEDK